MNHPPRNARVRRLALAIATLVLAAAAGAGAQEGQGYAEARASFFPGADGDVAQLVEQLRPTFATPLGERFKLVATVDLTFTEGRGRPEQYTGAADYLEVSRLYLDYYSPRLDLRAGRQALHWGSAQFFNPTDPFPEVLLAEPWRPRAGVNALRAHLAFSPLADATAVAAVDDALAEPRAALRLRANRWGADLALSGVWRGDTDWLAGVDVRGTLGVGYWVEAAERFAGDAVHEELAAGVDYSFDIFRKLVVMAQYYRNGAGETSPERYRRPAASLFAGGTVATGPSSGAAAAADPFAALTLARDYLLASVSAQLTEEWSASLPILQNLDDGSGVALPSLTWAALGWLEFSCAADIPFIAWGSGGEFKRGAGFPGGVPAAILTFWTRASF